MSDPISPMGPRRRIGRRLALGALLTVVVASCATGATAIPAGPGASSVTAAPSTAPSAALSAAVSVAPSTAPSASPIGGATAAAGSGTAAAWCAFVIEINTKYGYMTNKNFSRIPPSMDVQRQIVTEAMSRLDDLMRSTAASSFSIAARVASTARVTSPVNLSACRALACRC